MSWIPERRYPPGPRPCLGSELLREVLADEKSSHLLLTEHASGEANNRLTAREWFWAHVMAFLIGAWNLFAVNLARTPDRWWFWIPVAAWASVLVLHAGRVVWAAKRPVIAALLIRRWGGTQ